MSHTPRRRHTAQSLRDFNVPRPQRPHMPCTVGIYLTRPFLLPVSPRSPKSILRTCACCWRRALAITAVFPTAPGPLHPARLSRLERSFRFALPPRLPPVARTLSAPCALRASKQACIARLTGNACSAGAALQHDPQDQPAAHGGDVDARQG